MTVVAHIERCPVCQHRVFVRAKGTFVTHYKTALRHQNESNQCPASRMTPADALGLAYGMAAYLGADA